VLSVSFRGGILSAGCCPFHGGEIERAGRISAASGASVAEQKYFSR